MLNLPNALSAFRLVGSLVLVGLALAGWRQEFAWLLAALLVSDWIDGKIAIAWQQQTPFGARLDSVADALMYAAFLFGLGWLESNLLRREWPWVAAVLASYGLTCAASLCKFRCFPTYHTRSAKTSWLLVSLGALSLFLGGPLWPLQVAAVVVVGANLEGTAITAILPQSRSDVASIRRAWQIRTATRRDSQQHRHHQREQA